MAEEGRQGGREGGSENNQEKKVMLWSLWFSERKVSLEMFKELKPGKSLAHSCDAPVCALNE